VTPVPSGSTDAYLDVREVSKRFGGFQALSAVSLRIRQGERFGLIGPNGSGKTTLINCISGTLRTDGGRIVFEGADITGLPAHRRTRLGIARSFQIPKPFTSMTVLENLLIPIEYARHAHHDGVVDEAMAILAQVGLAAKAQVPSRALTQIEMRKLELARAMAARPKLLVSDEAMAGLSATEVDDILAILFQLNQRGITVIMIEHIMRAIMRFSERIAVLDAGEKIAEGTPEQILSNTAVERAYLGE
jgi:branched-chain amino acid transport system ATP-binding protein